MALPNFCFVCTKKGSAILQPCIKKMKSLYIWKRHRIILIGLFVVVILRTDLVGQNYSIKNRWNAKMSLSYNRINTPNSNPHILFDNIPAHPIQAMLNARAECNYGVLNWLELGGYIGYIRYFNVLKQPEGYFKKSFTPTFGVNANVHLLPFWVKNKNCRWELYVTAKYGGTYLIHYYPFETSGFIWDSQTGIQEIKIGYNPNRYRSIFGAGIGGGVYFKNVFGLYAEVLAGQYSYFPEACKSYYTARVGIEFKFYSKKGTKKAEKIEDETIIYH